MGNLGGLMVVTVLLIGLTGGLQASQRMPLGASYSSNSFPVIVDLRPALDT